MRKSIIYRQAGNGQDRFILATTRRKTKSPYRSLELCKELYLEETDFENLSSVKRISIDQKEIHPNQLRRDVYLALLQGFLGIEYDSIYFGGITKNSERGKFFRYLQDMNYRITQYGRTLMALRLVGIYCEEDVLHIYPELRAWHKNPEESHILQEQTLQEGLAIAEFTDEEGNSYLMWQNMDCGQATKVFQVKLKKPMRVYRVNPHTGQQMLLKDSLEEQKIMMMSGDGDILRYQDTQEEAFLIEYALRK